MSIIDRPAWLTEPCPAWCSEDHSAQECPPDRRHESEVIVLPVIQRTAHWPRGAAAPVHGATAEEYVVVAFREVGTTESWVVVANEQKQLEVSLESAVRLHAVLGELLARRAD